MPIHPAAHLGSFLLSFFQSLNSATGSACSFSSNGVIWWRGSPVNAPPAITILHSYSHSHFAPYRAPTENLCSVM